MAWDAGERGHRIALEHRHFRSQEEYDGTMRAWNTAGRAFFGIWVVLVVIAIILWAVILASAGH